MRVACARLPYNCLQMVNGALYAVLPRLRNFGAPIVASRGKYCDIVKIDVTENVYTTIHTGELKNGLGNPFDLACEVSISKSGEVGYILANQYFNALDTSRKTAGFYIDGTKLVNEIPDLDFYGYTSSYNIHINPLAVGKYAYYLDTSKSRAQPNVRPYNIRASLYSNRLKSPVKLRLVNNEIEFNTIVPSSYLVKNNVIFLAKNNKLMISSPKFDANGNLLLYFPKYNENVFNDVITGLHSLTDTEIAIFFKNSIWYVEITENGYIYHKTKLDLGLMQGSDVITSFDGKYTIFPSGRGLTYLSYQDFVSSTDQVATFLTDEIYETYRKFNNNDAIKLYKHAHFIFMYKENSDECFLLDGRNNSWWKWSFGHNIVKIFDKDDLPTLLLDNNDLYALNYSDEDYYDKHANNNLNAIHWKLESQKLYLGSIERTKYVKTMVLGTVTESKWPMSMKLECHNYRKKINDYDSETMMYDVDAIRTFVKKLNYTNCTYFQYELSNNDAIAVELQTPLSLCNISIKYKMGGITNNVIRKCIR